MLELFRITFNARPLQLLILAAAVLTIASRVLLRDPRRTLLLLRACAVIAAAGAGVYVVTLCWYASEPHFFDNAEPTIVATAWVVRLGAPVYPAIDAAQRYAHIYGPLAFQLHAAALAVLGPGILVSKGFSAACALASLGLLFVVARGSTSRRRAFVLCGLACWWCLGFQQKTFWTRPEPFEWLAVTLALWGALRWRGVSRAVLVGLCAGVLFNLKFTGVLYVLPAIVLALGGASLVDVIAMSVAALASAIAPFVLFDTVSWTNYQAWVKASASSGLLFDLLHQNLEAALVLWIAPFLAWHIAGRPRQPARHIHALVALAVGMGLVAVAAAKPGAGPYHLIPFVPIVVWAAAIQIGHEPIAVREPAWPVMASALVLTLAAIAVAQLTQFVAVMQVRRARHEIADIDAFVASHDGPAAMGYGSDESLSLERPALVFLTGINPLDQPAMREYHMQHIPLPAATLDALGRCVVQYWLIPHGEAPFSGRNSYASVLGEPIFPQSFRDTFARTYRIRGETRYYDIWECHVRGE